MIRFKQHIKLLIIEKSKSIGEAINKINLNKMKTIFVVNDIDKKYIGSVTDGDLRRGIVRNLSKKDNIMTIVNKKSIFLSKKPINVSLEKIFSENYIQCIPLLDKQKKIKEIYISKNYQFNQPLENSVVILAGGLGKRLLPITKKIPKPMIRLNGKPIISHLIQKFKSHGFNKFVLCLKYKSNLIKKYLNRKEKLGIKLRFKNENKFLGTAGPILNAKKYINKTLPFFVSNSDIITNVNFLEMLNFHNDNKADVTILSKFYEEKNKYGVIKNKGIYMRSLEEKPNNFKLINCGVYVISPDLLRYFKTVKKLDMTDFIQILSKKKKKIIIYPAHEFWMDIGNKTDLIKSKTLIKKIN